MPSVSAPVAANEADTRPGAALCQKFAPVCACVCTLLGGQARCWERSRNCLHPWLFTEGGSVNSFAIGPAVINNNESTVTVRGGGGRFIRFNYTTEEPRGDKSEGCC